MLTDNRFNSDDLLNDPSLSNSGKIITHASSQPRSDSNNGLAATTSSLNRRATLPPSIEASHVDNDETIVARYAVDGADAEDVLGYEGDAMDEDDGDDNDVLEEPDVDTRK